ncbi:MAG: NirD/YgiW/YdeI family stress tolerance protein [Hormoscilla sp.]
MNKTIAIALCAASFLLPVSGVRSQTPIGDLQRPHGVTISGTVKSVVGNEFILRDSSGEIIVDAGPRWRQEINLTPGERVTVVGEYDDDDFDAYSISRSSGEVIQIRTEDDDDPWEER